MAKYRITSPDGGTYEVTAPDTASEQDVLAYAQSQFKQQTSNVGPTDDHKLRASMPARATQGVRDFIDAGAQLLTHALPEGAVNAVNRGVQAVNNLPVIGPATVALGMTPASTRQVDQGIAENEKAYQEARKATGNDGIDFARMGGNIAVTAPLTAYAPGANALKFGQRVASGGAAGAAFGAMQPVTENQGNFAEEKAKQIAVGGAMGTVAPAVVEGVSRVIKPNTRPQVEALLREGVTPTPGQILGGAAQKLESKATSIPILGDAIASSQKKGVDEFNRAMYARALRSIDGKVPSEVGREGVQAVKQQLGRAYDDLLPRMKFAPDEQFTAEIANLRDLASKLPAQMGHHGQTVNQFESILKSQVLDRMTPAGTMSGETLKTVESELGRLSKGYRGDASFDKRQLGDAIAELQATLRRGLERSNPELAQDLKSVNQGYANYARIRDAAARQGSNNGVVTPAQLAAAVRAGDKTVGKGAYATGNAMMQDLADAGKDVLVSKYPDSGTAGRLIAGTLAGGGLSAVSPAAAVTAGAATLPYLPGGRQLAAALLAKRPEGAARVAKAVRKLPPAASALLAQQILQANEQ